MKAVGCEQAQCMLRLARPQFAAGTGSSVLPSKSSSRPPTRSTCTTRRASARANRAATIVQAAWRALTAATLRYPESALNVNDMMDVMMEQMAG